MGIASTGLMDNIKQAFTGLVTDLVNQGGISEHVASFVAGQGWTIKKTTLTLQPGARYASNDEFIRALVDGAMNRYTVASGLKSAS